MRKTVKNPVELVLCLCQFRKVPVDFMFAIPAAVFKYRVLYIKWVSRPADCTILKDVMRVLFFASKRSIMV